MFEVNLNVFCIIIMLSLIILWFKLFYSKNLGFLFVREGFYYNVAKNLGYFKI